MTTRAPHRTPAVLSVLAVSLLTLLAALGPVPPAAASTAVGSPAPAQTSPDQQPGLSEFGSCLSGQGEGSMVILIDQSGSLRTTDPDKARVRAAQYLVERMASFSQTTGISLDVRVAGFAAAYAGAGPWTALTPDTAEAVSQQIAAVGEDIKDYDTDYWNALEGARQDLADHDASRCRAVAWLSDGAYDLDVRGSGGRAGDAKPYAPGAALDSEEGVSQAEQAGKEDICRPTGVADQMRSSQVTLIGLGLSNGETDFSFMKRVVGGGGANAAANGLDQCGDVASPAGSFYPVSDIDSLLLAFDSISAPGATVRSESVSICQGDVCSQGESSFVLDGTLRDVHVLASSDVDGLEAYLHPPGAAEPIVIPAGTSGPQESEGVSYEWLTPRTLQIDLAAESVPVWEGQWRLAFVDRSAQSTDQEVHVNMHLSSPIALEWQDLGRAELRQGETLDEVRLTLVDRAGGEPIDLAGVRGSLVTTVSVTDSTGRETTLFESVDASELDGPVSITIGEDVALGQAQVTTSVTVTTAATTDAQGHEVAGTTLAPTLSTTTVAINPPLDFPSLSPQVDFGRLEERTSAGATLRITGPGCVWVPDGAAVLTGAPAEAGAITVSAPADAQSSCVSVPQGQTAELALTLRAGEHANGAITGDLQVMAAPLDDPDRAQPVAVPFRAEMRRPLDVALTWTTFLAALLAGVGIPLVALYAFKYLTARLPAGTHAGAATVVEVPEDGLEAAIDIPSREWTWLPIDKGARELTVGPCTLRTRMGIWPASIPSAVVVAPDAPSISGAPTGRSGRRAVLPVSIVGNWIAILDRPDSPRRVTLILLAQGTGQDAQDRVVQDARRHLADRVRTIAEYAPQGRGPGGGGAGAADSAATGLGHIDAGPSSGLPSLDEDDPFAGYRSPDDPGGSFTGGAGR